MELWQDTQRRLQTLEKSVAKLENSVTELEGWKSSIQSRDMLKTLAKSWSQLQRSASAPYVELNLWHCVNASRNYPNTQTFSRFLQPYNTEAHTIHLKNDFERLHNPDILRCVESDILRNNPSYEEYFKRYSTSDKITVILGYPEPRIARAIGMISCVFDDQRAMLN